MDTKTVTIDGQDYILGPIKTGVGRKLKARPSADPSDFNVAFLAASLRSGGNADATPEWVDENVDFFGEQSAFNTLLTAAYEVNGYRMKKTEPGEKLPEAGPAESTSIISTVQ